MKSGARTDLTPDGVRLTIADMQSGTRTDLISGEIRSLGTSIATMRSGEYQAKTSFEVFGQSGTDE